MKKPIIPANENARLNALKEYSILDTIEEKEYDDITLLASYIFQTPMSLISLIDNKRQWFKSHHGIDAKETPREVAFCAHAINEKNNIMVVPDSREDERFFDNPLVFEEPHIVFYVGVPLVNPDGYALGTLCVMDNKPREVNQGQISALKALANQLMKLFELRKKSLLLNNVVDKLKMKNKGLFEFAKVAAHDIKSPLNNIIGFSEILLEDFGNDMKTDAKIYSSYINSSAKKLSQLIEGILVYHQDSRILLEEKEIVKLKETIYDVINLVLGNKEANYIINVDEEITLFINKTALNQILINLISNSLKYNNKTLAEITISVEERENNYKFNVLDNGPGIKDFDRKKIFNLFETTSNIDDKGNHGTGIGLATVKSLVENLGGEIRVASDSDSGANFEFTIPKNVSRKKHPQQYMIETDIT